MAMKTTLVVGANGGIGHAVVNYLCEDPTISLIETVSRSEYKHQDKRVFHTVIDVASEDSIKRYVNERKTSHQRFDAVYICTGILHSDKTPALKPEKRLEDISQRQFLEYFQINTIQPSIWLSALVSVMTNNYSVIALITARVGSIEDNRLGGWYGYRSSKAALNMVIKSAAVEYARRSPSTRLLSYHPGTVDTSLSKPFQANVAPKKLFTADFTAQRLVDLSYSLDIDESPYFLDWAGKPIPW